MRKPKIGDIVQIVFYDHADMEDTCLEPLKFEAFGRLMEDTDIHYRIAPWITPGAIKDPNAEYYSIIKGAIERVRVLK